MRIAVLAALLAASPAFAAEPGPGGVGARVGAWTLAGEVIGVAGGGAAGMLIGVAGCGGSSECYLPVLTTIGGAALGGVAGTAVGMTSSVRNNDADLGRAVVGALAGVGVGTTVALLGVAAGDSPVGVYGGLGLIVLGAPAGAAIGVATDKDLRVAVAPAPRGFAVVGRF